MERHSKVAGLPGWHSLGAQERCIGQHSWLTRACIGSLLLANSNWSRLHSLQLLFLLLLLLFNAATNFDIMRHKLWQFKPNWSRCNSKYFTALEMCGQWSESDPFYCTLSHLSLANPHVSSVSATFVRLKVTIYIMKLISNLWCTGPGRKRELSFVITGHSLSLSSKLGQNNSYKRGVQKSQKKKEI